MVVAEVAEVVAEAVEVVVEVAEVAVVATLAGHRAGRLPASRAALLRASSACHLRASGAGRLPVLPMQVTARTSESSLPADAALLEELAIDHPSGPTAQATRFEEIGRSVRVHHQRWPLFPG